jgi:hypothetical protein
MHAISGRRFKILICGINKVHISVHNLTFLESEMCRLLLQGFSVWSYRRALTSVGFPFRFTTCIEPVRDVTLLNSNEQAAACAALLERKAKIPVISSHVWPLHPFCWIMYTHNGTPSMVSWVSEYNIQCYSCRRLQRPWGFQEAESAIFQDNQHMKVVRV